MATTSLVFSVFSAALVAGRNRLAVLSVGGFSSIRIYAFVRPASPQITVYLINPDLHDPVGTDPDAGALDSFVLNALEGKTAWYPLPGLKLAIEAFTQGPAFIDVFVYGLK
ncbi:MAG: hypothetical protein M3Z32_03485 [Acidobacteriota bacterium]|nr:hypothetical protein [Acidobacteriota bacterium]